MRLWPLAYDMEMLQMARERDLRAASDNEAANKLTIRWVERPEDWMGMLYFGVPLDL
jgi:hypothetical protein